MVRLRSGFRPDVHRFGNGADDETAGRAVEGNGEDDYVWWAAAEIIGVSDQTMCRWRERFEQEGYAGLPDRRKGKPASHRVPLETVEEVFRLYQEQYKEVPLRSLNPAIW